jgi:hypothetical protein
MASLIAAVERIPHRTIDKSAMLMFLLISSAFSRVNFGIHTLYTCSQRVSKLSLLAQ